MQSADIKSLTEAYYSIYAPKEETVEITEELLDEAFDELVDEFIEEGYEEEEALAVLEEATDAYLEEAKVTFGSDTAPLRASGARVGARRRYGKRKAGEALKAAGEKAKSAVDSAKGAYKTAKAGVQIAGSIAKDEARRAGRKAAHAVTSAPGKAKAAVDRKKKETKRGIKGFIKRQAEKVVKRMSEGANQVNEMAPMKKAHVTASGQQRYTTGDGKTTGPAGAKLYNTVRSLKNKVLGDDYELEGEMVEGYVSVEEGVIYLEGNQGPSTPVRIYTFPDGSKRVQPYVGGGGAVPRKGQASLNKKPTTQMAGYEPEGEMVDEARRADKEGYARGSKENPKRKDVSHGDPSQRTMLHSRIKRRADEMGRERRSSARNKAGGRTPVSKKEKAFLQAADRTRQQVRNPNVPDTGKHKKQLNNSYEMIDENLLQKIRKFNPGAVIGNEIQRAIIPPVADGTLDTAARNATPRGRRPRKEGFEALQASGLFSEQELAKIAEQMTTQTQIPPAGDTWRRGTTKPPAAPQLPPPPSATKKKPEPKLGHGTPGFGYGVGTGP